jgi:hypothetical protein
MTKKKRSVATDHGPERSPKQTAPLCPPRRRAASGSKPKRAAADRSSGGGNSVVFAEYDGLEVAFTSDGWFNATTAAARFGKKPAEWLRLPGTKRYVRALARRIEAGFSHFVRTERGQAGRQGGGATWLHPKLAVRFAQWLDVDFAVWCDQKVDELLRGRDQSLFGRRIALETRDATSKDRASIGSHLMHARRRELPAIVQERSALEAAMQADLFLISHELPEA